MAIIRRDYLLNQLMIRRNSNRIKVITGLRRCGKSYLLFNLYSDALLAEGIPEHQKIAVGRIFATLTICNTFRAAVPQNIYNYTV